MAWTEGEDIHLALLERDLSQKGGGALQVCFGKHFKNVLENFQIVPKHSNLFSEHFKSIPEH